MNPPGNIEEYARDRRDELQKLEIERRAHEHGLRITAEGFAAIDLIPVIRGNEAAHKADLVRRLNAVYGAPST